MKNLSRKIKPLITSLKVLKTFKYFFRTGFYEIDPKKHSFLKTSFFKSLLLPFRKKIGLFIIGNGKLTNATYSFGDSKKVLFIDNVAYIKYNNENDFAHFLKIAKIGDLLPYKHAKTLSFDYSRLTVKQSRIIGNHLSNNFEEVKWFLLNYCKLIKRTFSFTITETFANADVEILYILQHGDFGHNNIIVSNNQIQVVDYDDMNFYPLFYDVFYFLFIKCEIELVSDFYESGLIHNVFNETLTKYGISNSLGAFNKYFYAFVCECTSEKNLYNRFIYAKRIKNILDVVTICNAETKKSIYIKVDELLKNGKATEH